jgi:hypothetical protein
MSYNNHRRQALDQVRPFKHRASHARSCTIHVSQKFRVHRDVVLDWVLAECGVDLRTPETAADLEKAIEALDRLRFEGFVDANKNV